MAFESQVPALIPTWAIEGLWPSYSSQNEFPDTPSPGSWAWRGPGSYFNNPPSSGGAVVVDGPSTGGVGAITRLESVGGVNLAARWSTTGAVVSQCWKLPWMPSVVDPGAVPLGDLLTREDFRVCWLRECFLYTTNTGDATCGRVLSFDAGSAAAVHWAQGGDAVQQCGLFGDGAGGLQYRSYSAAPALLETVAVPIVAGWNVADWIITSSAPGRPATLQLRMNNAAAIARTFGTAVLPYENGPGRVQWVNRMTVAGGEFYVNYLHLRCGKYDPVSGLPVSS